MDAIYDDGDRVQPGRIKLSEKSARPAESAEVTGSEKPSDLSEQMRRMIEMQYEQQLYSSSEAEDATFGLPPPLGSSSSDCTESIARRRREDSWGIHSAAESGRTLTKTPYNSVRLTSDTPDDADTWLREVSQKHRMSAAMSSNTPVSSTSPMPCDDISAQSLIDPTVGRGTLLFNNKRPLHDSGLPRSPVAVLPQESSPPISTSRPTQDSPGAAEESISSTPKQTNLTLLPLNDSPTSNLSSGLCLTKSVGQHMNLASYGALLDHQHSSASTSSDTQDQHAPSVVGTETTGSSSAAESTIFLERSSLEPQQNVLFRQQQPQDRAVEGYHGPITHPQEHYYGHADHPSYQNTYSSSAKYLQRRAATPSRSCFRLCCSCLWQTIWNSVLCLAHAESLHRSFCYGAIDGVLTGSGIVATFCGLQLIGSHSVKEVHLLLLMFSFCACLSDSVGMAIGHVWTTHVAAAAQARERSTARLQFQRSKHTAKGQLVDLLLSRGMLKIDAMSLADTLEGYPDLFVSALSGESLVGDSPVPSPISRGASYRTGLAAEAIGDDLPSPPPGYSDAQSPPHYQRPPPPPPAILSYGRLTDYDMDPEEYNVAVATHESRLESLCMMISFTLFAVLPALILNVLWHWSAASDPHRPRSMLSASSSSGSTGASGASSANPNTYGGMNSFAGSNVKDHPAQGPPPVITPLSIALTLGACLMWCLGVWKSRFLDHTYWVWFGVESVVVFGLCIATAFGLGAVLRALVLRDLTYVITTQDRPYNDDAW